MQIINANNWIQKFVIKLTYIPPSSVLTDDILT